MLGLPGVGQSCPHPLQPPRLSSEDIRNHCTEALSPPQWDLRQELSLGGRRNPPFTGPATREPTCPSVGVRTRGQRCQTPWNHACTRGRRRAGGVPVAGVFLKERTCSFFCKRTGLGTLGSRSWALHFTDRRPPLNPKLEKPGPKLRPSAGSGPRHCPSKHRTPTQCGQGQTSGGSQASGSCPGAAGEHALEEEGPATLRGGRRTPGPLACSLSSGWPVSLALGVQPPLSRSVCPSPGFVQTQSLGQGCCCWSREHPVLATPSLPPDPVAHRPRAHSTGLTLKLLRIGVSTVIQNTATHSLTPGGRTE